MAAAVDFMAFDAAALRHRAVEALAVFDELFHIPELGPIGEGKDLVVAFKAEVLWLIFEEGGVIAGVGIVAVGAGPFGGHGGMLGRGGLDGVGNILMTFRAEFHWSVEEQCGAIGCVRLVADAALAQRRGVHDSF